MTDIGLAVRGAQQNIKKYYRTLRIIKWMIDIYIYFEMESVYGA